MAAADTARLVAELTLKDKLSAGVKSAMGSLNQLEGSVGRVGKGAGQLAGGLVRVGAIAAGAAATGLAYAAKQAIDFEDAFAGVRKTVDEADLTKAGLSFDQLAKSFRTMATEIPIAATEFAAIGETAGALGIAAGDLETFTKTVALLGVTTNLTSAEAAESLGKIGTILGLTGKDYTTFADALVNLGNRGASTESEIIEITKRFGAAGQAAGLSTPQILAFSSAIASAGVEPEAAGSSLSRLFGNLIKETALATAKGKAFAEISGKSFKDFSTVVEKDTNGAMLLFLDSLRKLDKFDQERALKAVGITAVRDRNAIRLLAASYERNLIPAIQTATESTGALSTEATKRFDTIRSKLLLLKQNFIEAAITVGEGFTPALGRATDKLIAFLKVDANKAELRKLGEDIGAAIDKIDWQQVLDGAKTFLEVMKTIASVVLAIPNEIKAAGIALIGLNKLSGGLFGAGAGNIIGGLAGGLARGVAAKVPGVGSLFAQPVYVVNMPIGGLGGAPGIGGAASGAAGAAGGFLAPGLVAAAAAAAVPLVMFQVIPNLFKGPEGAGIRGSVTTPTGTVSESQRQTLAALSPFFEAQLAKQGKTQDVNVVNAAEISGDRPMNTGPKSMSATLNEFFGPHGPAAAAFGADQLRQFRGGDISLLDERIRYLSGAQGSGAGSPQFLAVVGRDIAALRAELPRASASDAEKIRGGIDALTGILEAKKFTISPDVISAITSSQGRDSTEAAEKIKGAIWDSTSRTVSAADRSYEAIERLRAQRQAINLTVNVDTAVTVRDITRKVTSSSKLGYVAS